MVKNQLLNDIPMPMEWKSCELIDLNIQIDHVHLIISLPPKMSISQFIGTLKGKIAIKLFKSYPQLKVKPYWGNHFLSRVYCADTIGLDEEKIKKYVKYQEEQERVEEQHRLSINPLSGHLQFHFLRWWILYYALSNLQLTFYILNFS